MASNATHKASVAQIPYYLAMEKKKNGINMLILV